jgi:hypothetical protein
VPEIHNFPQAAWRGCTCDYEPQFHEVQSQYEQPHPVGWTRVPGLRPCPVHPAVDDWEEKQAAS